ncbi:hypothetical protein SAMN05421805_107275 [Saccharopolyspora antimicrobica]|uniref:Uncharacterized protein n=1 Tax=Saccharopolyspora antimicrobica TaxID=455193 RepID=A0A1I5CSX8_9PSEU|nr:hypothetical protein [Saccharopolyspora antimicrobica]RKT88765.1 hypothetical protein ATL45_7204 [Saccharopolyspora antimicrobica]SFN89761.1 hypothetical protein SAMN05421805_107275 [Saccharopolyspora antimicrobica]
MDRKRVVGGLILSTVLLASCGSAASAPDFAVATGADGLTLVGADWTQQVPGFGTSEASFFPPGDSDAEIAAPLDSARAVVVYADRVVVVARGAEPVVRDCAECTGVAVTDTDIVTTRTNHAPDNGFDLVLYDHELSAERVVPAQRLQERASTSLAENTESPVTLAADEDRITVGYLARDGGNRRGPSVIAQYDYAGQLLGSTKVDGLLGRSAVSPDGRLLAVGVGGSSGYCTNPYEPVIVDLATLRVREVEPAVPGTSPDDPDPWFELTDLVWAGETLLATGELHVVRDPGEVCDPEPEVWQRAIDPETGAPADSGGHQAISTRQVGPGCDHVVQTVNPSNPEGSSPDGDIVLRRVSGHVLGDYSRISLGMPASAACAGS